MSDVNDEVKEMVEEVTSPKSFNVIDAISNRSYPHTTVNVFLNEELAYEASVLEDEIDDLQPRAVNDESAAAKLDVLEKKRDAIVAELEASCLVFHVYGISEGDREDIYNIAVKDFPVEYEESKNPYTGESVKNEIDNVERDRLFTTLLWQAQIRKIVASDGAEQSDMTKDDVEKLRRQLPIAALGSINQAIEKVRIATASFMLKVNQDFLAKR